MLSLDLLKELVTVDSTSPFSNVKIANLIEQMLLERGFSIEHIDYTDPRGESKVNLIAKKGTGTGGLAYFCHNDVVPADDWFTEEHGPFVPMVKDGRLYGRGSCDMKGSLACMLAAVSQVDNSDLKAPVYITCTADEELDYSGAEAVATKSELFQEMVAENSRGIIGEPTCLEVVYAHKGSITLQATSRGESAHSSTSEGLNANLAMIPFLVEMKKIHDETETNPAWQDNRFDPPTVSWNIGINDHTTAVSMKPAQSICTIYFRPMPGQKVQGLIDRVKKAAEAHGLELEILNNDAPLYRDPQSSFIQEMLSLTGRPRAGTVSYGTDGTKLGALKDLVVFGPGDIRLAHTNHEHITLEDLEQGTAIFRKLIHHWCC